MKTKWHKVSDKLPPIDKDVLVIISHNFNDLDIGCINERGEWETNLGIGWCNIITHWMLLPEPPK